MNASSLMNNARVLLASSGGALASESAVDSASELPTASVKGSPVATAVTKKIKHIRPCVSSTSLQSRDTRAETVPLEEEEETALFDGGEWSPEFVTATQLAFRTSPAVADFDTSEESSFLSHESKELHHQRAITGIAQSRLQTSSQGSETPSEEENVVQPFAARRRGAPLRRRLSNETACRSPCRRNSRFLSFLQTSLIERFFRPEPFDRQRFSHPKPLGRAIYGEITVANDLVLRRKVVIKSVRIDDLLHAKHKSGLEDPLNEFSLIRYLFSKCSPCNPLFIVIPYALMQDEKQIYLVQEFCPGGELYYKLKQEGSFREDKARSIAVQLVFALMSLHANFVCHRDISLENILIGEDRSIRLVDFGQADRLIDEHGEPKYLTGRAGKAYYRAPEVYIGSYLGAPVDIFALGVLIYILVTGYPPFESAVPADYRFRIISSAPNGLHRSLLHEGLTMSDDLVDFLSAIFFRPAAQRPTLVQLLTHRWLVKDPKAWAVVNRVYPQSELVRRMRYGVEECAAGCVRGQRFWRPPQIAFVNSKEHSGHSSVPADKEMSVPSAEPFLWKPSRSRLGL